jgi:hypothetical protein
MPQDDVRLLEATIATLKAQQEADRRELLAARAETLAIRAAATEAMPGARLEVGAGSFLARNWAPLLVAGLMAPLMGALIIMLDQASARTAACKAELHGQVIEPTVPPSPRVTPPRRVYASLSAGDAVGVPACDNYINKYAACVEDKIPVAQRALMQRSLVTMRQAWRKAAATEIGRQSLSRACETAMATARKSMATFKCQW